MNKTTKILGVIPARYNSSRLPGKVLREIAGKPMIYWVYKNALRSPLLQDLLIATDSELVLRACHDLDLPVTMTGEHPTGSDRLHEVMQRTDADIYVNIQGDEPTVRPEHIDGLLLPLLSGTEFDVSTLKVKMTAEAALSPDAVKVVTAKDGAALYFSRLPIPYHRNSDNPVQHYKHIGLYAYRREALQQFFTLSQTPLELSEMLEQLRLIENGIRIHVGETEFDTVGVDTERDLNEVIALFSTAHPSQQ